MAAGDIGSEVQTLEFDTSEGTAPVILHVSGNVYAIFYNTTSVVPTIKTYTISDVGVISDVISTATLTYIGRYPSVYHIPDTTIYIIAYRSRNGDASGYDIGRIQTISIGDTGIIGSEVETLIFHDKSSVGEGLRAPILIHVDGTVYAVVYNFTGGVTEGGWLTTINVNDDGSTLSVLDSYEFDATKGINPDILHITGTIYAIPYSDTDTDGQILTLNIAIDGTIGSVLDTLEFDTSTGDDPKLIHIYGSTYAIVYVAPDNDGWIKTFTITSLGAITEIAEYEFATNCDNPKVISVSWSREDKILAIIFQGSSSTIVVTVPVSVAGTISAYVDFLTFSGSYAYIDPDIIHIAGSYYAMVGSYFLGSDGYLKTFDIDTTNVYPSGGLTRVTSLIHRYNRGIYNLEIFFGDVVSDFNIPEIGSGIKKSYEPTEIPTTVTFEEIDDRIKIVEEKYPDIPGFLEESMRERRPEGLSPWEKVTPWREEAGQTFGVEVGKAWQKITPWQESKGETFGSEVMERVKAVGDWFGGLFK